MTSLVGWIGSGGRAAPRRPLLRRARPVVGLAGVVALALTAGACSSSAATDAAPPGSTTLATTDPAQWVERQVPVNGTTIAVTCKGTGAKTVVLVSGLGEDGASTWGASAVPDLVARDTRVCRYDRPGLGASGPATAPPTVATQVADLAALVGAGAIPAPVVAVGQGYGTLVVRMFARDHLRSLAGVVLVDPPVALLPESVPAGLSPGQLAEYQALPAIDANFGDFGSGKLPPPPLPSIVVIHTDLAPLPPDAPAGAPRVPAPTTEPVATGGTVPGSAAAAPGTAVGAGGGLVPAASLTPEQRRMAQQQLAHKSPYGSFVVVDGSGAYVQYWKPEAVADAVRRVLADTRGAR